jgi:hypothetical protein
MRLSKVGLAGPSYFDSVILGGGTLINPGWTEIVGFAQSQGHRMWTFGTGAGSYGFGIGNDTDISEWSDLLGKFQGLGVRGPLSVQRLNAMGLKNVEMIGDSAFTLTLPQAAPLMAKRFVLNVTLPPEEAYDPQKFPFLSQLEAAVKECVANGWEVVPVAMNPDDFPAIEGVLRAIGLESISTHQPLKAQEYLDLLSGSSFSIGVRLHACIISYCAGVPTLMLGYRDKCLDFMKSMDMEEWYIDIDSPSSGRIEERTRALIADARLVGPIAYDRARHWQDVQSNYVKRMISA